MEKEKQLMGMCGSSKNRKDKGEDKYGYTWVHIFNNIMLNCICYYNC